MAEPLDAWPKWEDDRVESGVVWQSLAQAEATRQHPLSEPLGYDGSPVVSGEWLSL